MGRSCRAGLPVQLVALIFGHKYGLTALALIAWLSAGSKSEVGKFAGKMQRERQAALKHGKVYPPVK